MAKNILVLTGSPRKGGNTDQLADAFIAAARRSGHTVTKYATNNKNRNAIEAILKKLFFIMVKPFYSK